MRLEVLIEEEPELQISKELGALAYGKGNPALYDALKPITETPFRLGSEASVVLLNELVNASVTSEGMDVGVSPTIASGMLRKMGFEIA